VTLQCGFLDFDVGKDVDFVFFVPSKTPNSILYCRELSLAAGSHLMAQVKS
jgi:hypothetical protein